jgi:hypothetical protein
MPILPPFSILAVVGILIYGWTAEYAVRWFARKTCAAVFAMGSLASVQSATTYIADAYMVHAASIISTGTWGCGDRNPNAVPAVHVRGEIEEDVRRRWTFGPLTCQPIRIAIMDGHLLRHRHHCPSDFEAWRFWRSASRIRRISWAASQSVSQSQLL